MRFSLVASAQLRMSPQWPVANGLNRSWQLVESKTSVTINLALEVWLNPPPTIPDDSTHLTAIKAHHAASEKATAQSSPGAGQC